MSTPIAIRTYRTTFQKDMVETALEKEGINVTYGRGRIYFRLPAFPDTCLELLNGGTLMLKGPFRMDPQREYDAIWALWSLERKYFPEIRNLIYKLASVQVRGPWLRKILIKLIEEITGASLGPSEDDDFSNSFVRRLIDYMDPGLSPRFEKKPGYEFERDHFEQFLKLALSAEKDTRPLMSMVHFVNDEGIEGHYLDDDVEEVWVPDRVP